LSERRYFGTDGVRDVANRGAMTPEMAMRLGMAYVRFLKDNGVSSPRVVVGRDTRISGQMLELALSAGVASMGASVISLGVMPTPGVSFALTQGMGDGGAVVSASHNPAEYNGIKFFGTDGRKLPDEQEAAIESYLEGDLEDRPVGVGMGSYREDVTLVEGYAKWLVSCSGEAKPLGRGVIDCANGAICRVASRVFDGWDVTFTGNAPDGNNINDGCGVMHMENLSRLVRERKARFGVAFDGDADRTLLCDSKGRVIDGDLMLWVLARWLRARGQLGSGVVATVMSNMVLEEKLRQEGIALFRCPVGDRYVLETMTREGAMLGGEQSGHVIVSPWVVTGDGLCTALLFLRACVEMGEDLDSLCDRFKPYPQRLINMRVRDKGEVLDSPLLRTAVSSAEEILGSLGRVFVRPSGTEPLVRILLEARDEALLESSSQVFMGVLDRFHVSAHR